MHHILIVEDEIRIAETVKQYLEREGYTVQHVTSIAAALAIASPLIDLIILDLMLPDGSGEEVCEWVVKKYNTPVIILTAKSSEQMKIQGFSLGADDYLTKPFSPRELVMRVKSILKRTNPSGNSIRFGHDIVLDIDRKELTKEGLEIRLTPNEYSILLCLVKNAHRVVSREMLIEYIDGQDSFDRTIDVHVRHLRKKLEDDAKKPQIIQTVHGHGYMLGVKLHA